MSPAGKSYVTVRKKLYLTENCFFLKPLMYFAFLSAQFLHPMAAFRQQYCPLYWKLNIFKPYIVVILCPSLLENAVLSPDCLRRSGNSCSFTCANGYAPSTIGELLYITEGFLKNDTTTLCSSAMSKKSAKCNSKLPWCHIVRYERNNLIRIPWLYGFL